MLWNHTLSYMPNKYLENSSELINIYKNKTLICNSQYLITSETYFWYLNLNLKKN